MATLAELQTILKRHKETLKRLKTAPLSEDTRKELIEAYRGMIADYEFMIQIEKERTTYNGN